MTSSAGSSARAVSGGQPKRVRSMAVRRAAAKVAVKAAQKQGKEPDPQMVALAASR